MALSLPTPPNQASAVDSGEFREWFFRLWKFVTDFYSAFTDLSNTVTSIQSSFVPYFIPYATMFTVPLYKQALFEMTIDNEGILNVEGFLIQVD